MQKLKKMNFCMNQKLKNTWRKGYVAMIISHSNYFEKSKKNWKIFHKKCCTIFDCCNDESVIGNPEDMCHGNILQLAVGLVENSFEWIKCLFRRLLDTQKGNND